MTAAPQPAGVPRLARLAVLAAALLLPALAERARSQDAPPAPHPVDRAGELLARVVPRVEEACGTTFPEPPRVRVLSAREAEAVFREDLRDEVARRYPEATDAQRSTLLAATARSSVASCIARYSFHEEAIVVVRSSFDDQRERAGFGEDEAEGLLLVVLAHEAVHALDDVHHDLERHYAEAPDAEALRARAMVAEGRAVHFGNLAARAAGERGRALTLLPGGDAPSGLHTWMLRLTYAGGHDCVRVVEGRGGHDLGLRLLREPPATTHHVFHPERWLDGDEDTRPARLLERADLGAAVTVLSELALRARYASLGSEEASRELFAGFRGGAQALVDATNVAVLAFATAADATRYVETAGEEAPTERIGTLVLRAAGDAADALLARVRAAARAPLER